MVLIPEMQQILSLARRENASDIHIVADLPPMFRINGEIILSNRPALEREDTARLCYSLLNEEQKKVAEEVMRDIEASKIWNAPLVTKLEPFKAFYQAEDYHQTYFADNPNQPYCRAIIAPKVTKFREKYRARLKK